MSRYWQGEVTLHVHDLAMLRSFARGTVLKHFDRSSYKYDLHFSAMRSCSNTHICSRNGKYRCIFKTSNRVGTTEALTPAVHASQVKIRQYKS